MENPIQEFIIQPAKYFWFVISSMWKSFKGWTRMVKALILLVFILLALNCFIVIALLGGFPDWVTTSIDNISSDIGTRINYFIFGVFIFALLFPFLFVYEASKIHRNQEHNIHNLKEKSESPITNEGLEVYAYVDRHDNRVGIEIYNSTYNNTSKIKVELINLTFIPLFGRDVNYTLLPEIKQSNRSFHKGDRFNKDNGVDKLDRVFVYLAEVQNTELFFMLDNPFPFDRFQMVHEDEKIVNSIKKIEPSYIGYQSFIGVFEIGLSITVENVDSHQLIFASFKGMITFVENIFQWVQAGENKWRNVDSKPIIDINFEIREVKDEQSENKENPK